LPVGFEKTFQNKTSLNNVKDAKSLIENQNIAILSTVSKEGNVHGAVVHYLSLDDAIFVITRSTTKKVKNIALHQQVALTIHRPHSLKTVQISGLAEQENDKVLISKIYKLLSNPNYYEEGKMLPPTLNMKVGELLVIRILPINIKYNDYSKSI
jgi:general stress protein 26